MSNVTFSHSDDQATKCQLMSGYPSSSLPGDESDSCSSTDSYMSSGEEELDCLSREIHDMADQSINMLYIIIDQINEHDDLVRQRVSEAEAKGIVIPDELSLPTEPLCKPDLSSFCDEELDAEVEKLDRYVSMHNERIRLNFELAILMDREAEMRYQVMQEMGICKASATKILRNHNREMHGLELLPDSPPLMLTDEHREIMNQACEGEIEVTLNTDNKD